MTTDSSGAITEAKCDGDSVSMLDIVSGAFKTSSGEEESKCFPAFASVQMLSGNTKRMDELEIGDAVRVSATEFSPIFMFTHKYSQVVSSFVELRTGSGHHLSVTSGHFLYVNGKLSPASSIRVGDTVNVQTGLSGFFESSSVVAVTKAQREGLFNPQTIHGDIVVDGVLSSTYTTAVEPVVAHGLLAPLRTIYTLFGVSTRVFESTPSFSRSSLLS